MAVGTKIVFNNGKLNPFVVSSSESAFVSFVVGAFHWVAEAPTSSSTRQRQGCVDDEQL